MSLHSLRSIGLKNSQKEPSVAIISFNAQKTIKRALESVKDFREIVIVDNGSKDNTVKIAKQYTEKVYLNQVKNLRRLREFALNKITSDWVFFIDTDEVLTKKNKEKLLAYWQKYKDRFDGFWLARRNYYGKGGDDYLKHGLFYPDFQLRLFKKKYRYIDTPHETPKINSKKTFYCRDVEIYHYQDKKKLFSPLGIKYLLTFSAMYGRNLVDKKTGYLLFNAVYRFFDLFFVSLIRGKGLLDGYFGILAAFNFACHVSLIYLYGLYFKIKKNY